MTEPISRMVVEHVDALNSRPQWVFVTGTLSGAPISIGNTLMIRHAEGSTEATIRTIEIHSPPGKTTIALDSVLKPIIVAGTVIDRLSTP